MNTRAVRQAAGVAVLLAAVAAIGVLSVPYWENRALDGDLAALVARQGASGWDDDRWRVAVLEAAARRGVSTQSATVHVERRPGGPRVEIRYQKNVDLFVYAVRLHLRARSGS